MENQSSRKRSEGLHDVAALSEMETAKRIELFAVMLGAFPVARNQDLEVTLEGYVALTADVPLGWLTTAVQYLMMHPATVFAPTVGKVRERSAIEIIRTSRIADGKDPDRGERGITHVAPEHIDHQIARARRLMDLPAITPAASAVYVPAELEAKIAALGARIVDDSEAQDE